MKSADTFKRSHNTPQKTVGRVATMKRDSYLLSNIVLSADTPQKVGRVGAAKRDSNLFLNIDLYTMN